MSGSSRLKAAKTNGFILSSGAQDDTAAETWFGLAKGWKNVERQLSGYTPSIDAAIPGATTSAPTSGNFERSSSGSGQVQQYFFALTSSEFKDLLAKAENGDSFARGFANELNMSEGVA